MAYVIEDGAGRGGYSAAVNQENQLVVRAQSVAQRLGSALNENYYEATTGKITLSDASETGVLYLENSDADLWIVLDRVFYDVWPSTGGSGGGTLKYYINPTYTGGTDITPTNTNFGSRKEIDGVFKKSLTTISGTVWWTAYFSPASSTALEEGRMILKNGDGFGISVQAPAGNSSMDISVNVAMYDFNPDLI